MGALVSGATAPPGAPVLELAGVTRRFGQGRTQLTALAEADLVVSAGELVAVMGPSGSGKSTLLQLAGGLDRPDEGRISVDGHDISALAPAPLAELRRRSVGYVFQDLNLLAGLTAAENVSLPLELDGVRARAARAEAVAALDRVGMGELAGKFPDDLSGGERQRVAIARATVGRRRLVLADEPTGALDTLNGEKVMALLRRCCAEGTAVVMVTHDARLAAWADRIVFLRDGRVVDRTEPLTGPETLLDRAINP
ncbi:MAG: ABC transporter ATP-binding protein [Acidimicrobiia bacterium]